MNELDQQYAAEVSVDLAKLEKKNLGIEKLQQVEQRLIQTVLDTEDRIVLGQERTLTLVANPEANEELQEAAILLHQSREE
eukprot:5463285-Prorocentrum_lima.AAC.1